MPDPNVSDRERLLRLIDGGPEVVKEVQQQREAPAEKKPTVVVPAAVTPQPATADPLASFKIWWTRSGLDVSSVIKLCVALILLIVAIRSFTDLVQSMSKKEVPAPSAVPIMAVEDRSQDELAIGLRLVGVDWGDTPVALLEDLKTGKTYFAKKNDKIKETRVKEIYKDKVLASFRGKNVELR